ncbi:MAG: outer membrane beta-barrel protein [Acidobacteria bacterium]|nr:outer membrane beta-barrel protein [Acidobacteriota bacterium]
MRAHALILLPLAALALQAQEPTRYGIQGSLLFPTSDSTKEFTDKSMGFSIGAQSTWDLQKGQRLRGRVDYTVFSEKSINGGFGFDQRSISGYTQSGKLTGISGGVDYLYFFEGKPLGWYLAGGLTLNAWKAEATYSGKRTGSESRSKTTPGIAGGVGWQFNKNLGLEARGTWSHWEYNRSDNNATFFGVELNYRF